jgi:hypothetical protein
MHAAHNESAPVDQVLSTEHRLFSIHGLDPRLRQELTEQFESVLAFADFCTYLTAGRVSDPAGRLVDLAEAIRSETTDHLQRGVGRS